VLENILLATKGKLKACFFILEMTEAFLMRYPRYRQREMAKLTVYTLHLRYWLNKVGYLHRKKRIKT